MGEYFSSLLEGEFPEALIEIERVLSAIELPISEIIGSGGGETQFTQRLRRALATLNWKKHIFEIGKTIDGVPRESTSHEVDHVKRYVDAGVVAMEIEWNNKDPFYHRDLNNFSGLHNEGVIAVGVIITRGPNLQTKLERGAAAGFYPTSKYGRSTTHWDKLTPIVNLGGGGQCPLFLIGIEDDRVVGWPDAIG